MKKPFIVWGNALPSRLHHRTSWLDLVKWPSFYVLLGQPQNHRVPFHSAPCSFSKTPLIFQPINFFFPSPLTDKIQAIFGFFFFFAAASWNRHIHPCYILRFSQPRRSPRFGRSSVVIVSSHAPVALVFCLPTGFSCRSVCNKCAWRAISCVLAACRDSRPAEERLQSVIRCSKLYRLRTIRIFLLYTLQTTRAMAARNHDSHVASNPRGLCSDVIQSLWKHEHQSTPPSAFWLLIIPFKSFVVSF